MHHPATKSPHLIAIGALLVTAALVSPAAYGAEITRVWLTHRSNTPDRIVVNWTSKKPGDSVVRFGKTAKLEQRVRVAGERTLHHVEIPLKNAAAVWQYAVSTGDQTSKAATFKAYPTDVLRIAVVADWQGRPDLSAIMKDDIHLLCTAGDNIARLWRDCGEGAKDCVKPFAALVDAYPGLFRSTPFMPALGNHDREIRPRQHKPPAEPVYDIDATAFRRFFALPDDGWKWRLDLPAFDLRIIALDFNHISDHGTTWQSSHGFGPDAEQFKWYDRLTKKPAGLTVTLYNERNGSIRAQAGKRWHQMFKRGSCCITGFGHYAERAEIDGFPYFNTSLHGKGHRYPDASSKFIASEHSYVLLTVKKTGPMTVEIKSLKGKVLDRRVIERRRHPKQPAARS